MNAKVLRLCAALVCASGLCRAAAGESAAPGYMGLPSLAAEMRVPHLRIARDCRRTGSSGAGGMGSAAVPAVVPVPEAAGAPDAELREEEPVPPAGAEKKAEALFPAYAGGRRGQAPAAAGGGLRFRNEVRLFKRMEPTRLNLEECRVMLERTLLERCRRDPLVAGKVGRVVAVLTGPPRFSPDGGRVWGEFEHAVFDTRGQRMPALENEYHVITLYRD